MKARPLLVATALLAFAVARCGGVQKKSAESAADESAEAPDADEKGEGGAPGDAGAADAGPVAPEPPRPDPALVKKALDQSGAAVEGTLPTHGLRFEVVENGPRAGWAMALVNRGNEKLRVTADPSLLTIEVMPPPDPKAKKWTKPKKPRVCRLPPELRRERAAPEFTITLRPGRGFVEAFDPRLYCLPEQGVSPFVAGAKVIARFGFPPKTKVSWKKGARVEEPLPDQPPPFVAVVAPHHARDEHDDEDEGENGLKEAVDGGAADAASSDAGATDDSGITMEVVDAGASPEPVRGVKELTATPVELGPDYAPPPSAKVETLGVELVQGSDAASRSNVTATFKLTNHEKIARRVYLRRELVSFQVTGPDGTITCDPQPDERAPDRSAFTLLNAGGSISLTSRLAELCPEDAFQRPGLYVVEGQLDAFATGEEFGFEAFTGRLVSPRAVVVRVRSGTLPFPGPRVIQRVRVGTP